MSEVEREIDISQDAAAEMVRAMIYQVPWKDHLWARGALMMAARAIERGRHLTEAEKLKNLRHAIWGDAAS